MITLIADKERLLKTLKNRQEEINKEIEQHANKNRNENNSEKGKTSC